MRPWAEADLIYTGVEDDARQDAELGDLMGFLYRQLTPADRILEIGASFRPTFPKAQGWNTRTLDHLDQEALREKYAALGVDVSLVEPVDYVWRGERLPALVGDARFDCIFASHVIEHTTDMAGFLNDCAGLLTDDGIIALIVPDRRYCFDALVPLTDSAKVIADAMRQATRHSPEAIYRESQHLLANQAGAWRIAWNQGPVGAYVFKNDDPAAQLAAVQASMQPGAAYRDVHEYQFIPASFRLIIEELNLHGVIALRLAVMTRSRGCGFVAILTKQGARRMSLPEFQRFRQVQARAAILEQLEGHIALAAA